MLWAIIAPYDVKSKTGVRTPLIKVRQMINETLNVYYNGGGHFYFEQNNKSDWNILATYCINDQEYVTNHLRYDCHMSKFGKGNDDELIAIVNGKFGKGNVILTGCHPEMDPIILCKNEDESSSMIGILKEKTNNQKRLHLLQMMLSVFDINAQNKSKL